LSDICADIVLLSHILILGNRIWRGQTAEIDMKVVLDVRNLFYPLGLIGILIHTAAPPSLLGVLREERLGLAQGSLALC
jgi:hypothetical protein